MSGLLTRQELQIQKFWDVRITHVCTYVVKPAGKLYPATSLLVTLLSRNH
jgi:hypothetical protein